MPGKEGRGRASMSSDRTHMDIESLIKEVHLRPAIWDQKCLHYYNRDTVTKMWKEISNVCGMPCEAVRCKWKHLRDNYRKEYKKSISEKGRDPENPDSQDSRWVWFQSLHFLGEQLSSKRLNYKRHFKRDKSPQNTASDSRATPDQEDSPYVLSDGDCSQSLYISNTEDSDKSQFLQAMNLVSNPFRKRYCSGESEAEGPATKHQLLDHLFLREKDDTYHFLMSLMNPLKSLPFDRQMFVRFKMQKLIFNETLQNNGNQVPYSAELKSRESANVMVVANNHMDGSSNDTSYS